MADNTKKASLNDILQMGGLDRDVKVGEVMNTEGGEYCYRYA
jgi:hypothetical protein